MTVKVGPDRAGSLLRNVHRNEPLAWSSAPMRPAARRFGRPTRLHGEVGSWYALWNLMARRWPCSSMTMTVAVPCARVRDVVPSRPVRSMLVVPAGVMSNHDSSRNMAMFEPVSSRTSLLLNEALVAVAMPMRGLVVVVVVHDSWVIACCGCVGEGDVMCRSPGRAVLSWVGCFRQAAEVVLEVTETMATQVPPSCASSYEAFGEESTSLSVLTVALGSCLDPIS